LNNARQFQENNLKDESDITFDVNWGSSVSLEASMSQELVFEVAAKNFTRLQAFSLQSLNSSMID
jgi:hypothetical protein